MVVTIISKRGENFREIKVSSRKMVDYFCDNNFDSIEVQVD